MTNAITKRRRVSTSSASTFPFSNYSSQVSRRSSFASAASNAGRAVGAYYGGAPGAFAGGAAVDALTAYGFVPTAADAYDAPYLKNLKMGGGKYLGNFKKGTYKKDNWEETMLKKGYVIHEEYFGKVVDSNAVYLTHSTWDTNRLSEVLAYAILRKICKKAGLEINDRNGILPSLLPSDAFGLAFYYITQHPTSGVLTTSLYTTGAGETFSTLCTNFAAISASIGTLLTNATANIPYSVQIFQIDRAAVNAQNLMCKLDLTNEIFDICSYSELKLQNRTSGDLATAGNQDLDRMDTQPLIGTIYEFDSEPKVKNSGITAAGTSNTDLLKLQGVPSNGLRLLRAADFTTSISYQNRPPKGIWTNCKRTSNVVLQPGTIKRCALFKQLKGKLISLIPKMRLEAFSGAGIPQVFGAKCKAQTIVFEEVMRTIGTNAITVQYERKFRLGACLTTIPNNGTLKPSLFTTELNLP